MLTNWRTIRQRINELEKLERMRDKGEFGRLTKKEALVLHRKIERLEILLGGVRQMVRLPELVFVVDVHREATAIHEANLLNIPVIAMVDTNCDPTHVDYVIPSNDDAIRAIKLVVSKIADAVIEGKALRKELPEETLAAVPTTEEEELSDEELLGEATLAKISGRIKAPLDEDVFGEPEEDIYDIDWGTEDEDEEERLRARASREAEDLEDTEEDEE
jgi:small subunit ribosomal protein S2